MSFKDKVVMITGASEGIGAACARLFAQQGAKLSLNALPSPIFQESRRESELVVPGDITDAQVRSTFVDRTLDHYGRIDVLLLNAAVGQYGFPSTVDTEISKRMFDINVFSALALAQLVIPAMRSQRSGSIVNIGSVGGKVSLPWAVMYCATKWALHCVDDSLRRELAGTGIHVMKVCPGIVDTRFRDHVLAGRAPKRVENIKRVVTPDQVAAALASGLKRHRRTVYVPKIGLAFTTLEFISPRLMDWYLRRQSVHDTATGSEAEPIGTLCVEREKP
jgi:short-subunit dehydrogenase